MTHVSGSVRILKSKATGKQSWYLFYRRPDSERPDGVRQIKRKIGPAWTEKGGRTPAGFFTKRMAEGVLREVLADEQRGAVSQPTGATFHDATTEFLRYVREVRQIDSKTASDYEGVIDGYLLDEFGRDTRIDQITPSEVEAYRDRLMREGKLSNRTIVRHLTVMTGAFKRAKRVWGLAENPAGADVVERPKVVYTGEFDTFDRDEIELLATFADNDQDAAIIRVAAYTGLRQGELLALRWKWVDFVTGLVHVRKNFTGGKEKIPKGKKVRSVPMMPDVVTALAKLKEREHFTDDDDLVFVNEVGDHVDHFELRKRYYAALEAAGLRRIKFHDLRHAFGTAAISKLDAYSVQSYMGHQHYSTTQRYLHHKPRPDDAAKLAEAFGGGVTDGVTNQANSAATERN